MVFALIHRSPILANPGKGDNRHSHLMIGLWFFARPPVLSAAWVRENWFSLSFIAAPFCQPGPRA